MARNIELWRGKANGLVKKMEDGIVKSGDFVLLEKVDVPYDGSGRHPLFHEQQMYPSMRITRVYQLVIDGKPRVTKIMFTYDNRNDFASATCSLKSKNELDRELSRDNISLGLGKVNKSRVML